MSQRTSAQHGHRLQVTFSIRRVDEDSLVNKQWRTTSSTHLWLLSASIQSHFVEPMLLFALIQPLANTSHSFKNNASLISAILRD